MSFPAGQVPRVRLARIRDFAPIPPSLEHVISLRKPSLFFTPTPQEDKSLWNGPPLRVPEVGHDEVSPRSQGCILFFRVRFAGLISFEAPRSV